jgi:hypothetical protein
MKFKIIASIIVIVVVLIAIVIGNSIRNSDETVPVEPSVGLTQ